MDNILNSTLPLNIWRVNKGHGSFITFDMGDKVLVKKNNKEIEQGEFHLWVYLCDWTLSKEDKVLLTSDIVSDENFNQCESLLSKSSLVDINEQEKGSVILKFSDGSRLSLNHNSEEYDSGDEMFVLYMPKERTVSYCFEDGFTSE